MTTDNAMLFQRGSFNHGAWSHAGHMRKVYAVIGVLVASILLSVPSPLVAQTVIPTPVFLGTDNANHPIVGGKLCSFVAGTTTPANTYTSASLLVANANPVILDSAGRANVFLTAGQTYKFILKTAGTDATCNTGSTVWTQDGVPAIPTSSNNLDILGTAGEALTAGQAVYLSDGSGGKTAGQWYKADSSSTFSSTTNRVGFAPNSIGSLTPGTIRISGEATGLTSLSVGSTYFVGTLGAITASAPANRRVLGVADSTSSLVFVPAPSTTDLAAGTAGNTNFLRGDGNWSTGWTIVTSTTTGTVNDFAPGLIGNTILRMNNATLTTINGIAAGYDGELLEIQSVGAGQVDQAHQNGASLAANRFLNFATTGNTSEAPGIGISDYRYDGTASRWRLIAHEQGDYIDFSATSTIVGWTSFTTKKVRYKLSGRKLDVQWMLIGTSNAVTVTFTLPYTAISVGTAGGAGAVVAGITIDNGAFTATPGEVLMGDATAIVAAFATMGGGVWTNSGTKQSVGQMTVDVQ